MLQIIVALGTLALLSELHLSAIDLSVFAEGTVTMGSSIEGMLMVYPLGFLVLFLNHSECTKA